MRLTLALLLASLCIGCGSGSAPVSQASSTAPSVVFTPVAQSPAGKYENPLPVRASDGSQVESCPDPSIIRGQKPGDTSWYLYCTNERFSDNGYVHLLPMFKSDDLVNWTNVGDVFARMPSWVASDGGLWAPDIQYFNGKYYLYYSVSNTKSGGAGIFVATSDSPTGPWTSSAKPVVEPATAPCCGSRLRATIDSAIVADGDQRYIFYGSFNGGISARILSADGLSSSTATQVQITVPDRYEASYVVKRDGYFYLFVSAGNCCVGELSGYGVFVGRSQNPLGPYVDRDGNSLLQARVGGTPALSMNGNRWIGPGHNAVITDASGQDWMIYHAIDVNKPYFANSWTRRPVLMDPIDWIDGWPVVRNGAGPSDSTMVAPVIDPAQPITYRTTASTFDLQGPELPDFSDEFDGSAVNKKWSWIRQPSLATFGVAGGLFRFETQPGEIYLGQHTAGILVQNTPAGDYMVEVKLSSTVPMLGQFNYIQSGILIYKDDDNYVKLVTSSINGTRQIEFAKQYLPSSSTNVKYGSTFLSSPGDDTYLRLVKRTVASGETYTAYSSHDGLTWTHGPTWTHHLGSNAKLGLVSMAGAGYTTYFDYVRVYTLGN